MSLFGSRFGHPSNASLAASEKISLEYLPSSTPNRDIPADTMAANGFPLKETPLPKRSSIAIKVL